MSSSLASEVALKPVEIVAQYLLEPALRCIYTEGSTDQIIITDFLEHFGFSDVTIRTADLVSVANEDLDSEGLDRDSNRSNIILLARRLHKAKIKRRQVLCLADRDDQILFPVDGITPNLWFTDYTSLELYLFDENILKRFLTSCVRMRRVDARQLLVCLADILVYSFFVHAVGKRRRWRFKRIDPSRNISISGFRVLLDRTAFVERFLHESNQIDLMDTFTNEVQRSMAAYHGDSRLAIRGHDYTSVLFTFVSKHKGQSNPFRHVEGMEAAFFSVIRPDDLKARPFFAEILAFAKAGSAC